MKKTYLEFLRIFSILFVLFNHTNTYGFIAFPTTHNTFEYILSLSLFILCKAAVHIFFMISGSLLIPKEESISTVIQKRIGRILLVLVIFCIITNTYFDIISNNIGLHIRDYLKTIWWGDIGTYWFIYSYLALMIMLPLLRQFSVHLKREQFLYLLTLQKIIIQILPTILFLVLGCHMTMNLSVELFSENMHNIFLTIGSVTFSMYLLEPIGRHSFTFIFKELFIYAASLCKYTLDNYFSNNIIHYFTDFKENTRP